MKFRTAALVALCLMVPATALAEPCANTFSATPQAAIAPEASWREKVTHFNSAKSVAATDAKREKKIQKLVKSMTKEIVKEEETPLMEFIPAKGVKTKMILDGGGYGTGEITKIEVKNLGAKGILEGSLLCAVSGHAGKDANGVPNADTWRYVDTYSIHTELNPTSNSFGSGPHATIVTDAKSLEYLTVQELEIPMVKGQTVRILYERSGSMGPAGYIEGRALDFVWDGT